MDCLEAMELLENPDYRVTEAKRETKA